MRMTVSARPKILKKILLKVYTTFFRRFATISNVAYGPKYCTVGQSSSFHYYYIVLGIFEFCF